MSMFWNAAKINVKAGNGGRCGGLSPRKYVPMADLGVVMEVVVAIFVVDEGLRTMMDFRSTGQSPKWGKRNDQRDARTGAEDLCTRSLKKERPSEMPRLARSLQTWLKWTWNCIVAHGGRGGHETIPFLLLQSQQFLRTEDLVEEREDSN